MPTLYDLQQFCKSQNYSYKKVSNNIFTDITNIIITKKKIAKIHINHCDIKFYKWDLSQKIYVISDTVERIHGLRDEAFVDQLTYDKIISHLGIKELTSKEFTIPKNEFSNTIADEYSNGRIVAKSVIMEATVTGIVKVDDSGVVQKTEINDESGEIWFFIEAGSYQNKALYLVYDTDHYCMMRKTKYLYRISQDQIILSCWDQRIISYALKAFLKEHEK